MLEQLDRAGLADEAVGRPYPRVPADPAAFFHRWLRAGAVPGHEDGLPTISFFHCERTWWEERRRPNVLFVHFNDLKADLAGEMRRIAGFLDIAIEPELWTALVEAARFAAMRRDGAALMGQVAASFHGGADRFFHKGTNERWREIFHADDLALYESKAAAMLPPACRNWVAGGRLRAGDPRLAD